MLTTLNKQNLYTLIGKGNFYVIHNCGRFNNIMVARISNIIYPGRSYSYPACNCNNNDFDQSN